MSRLRVQEAVGERFEEAQEQLMAAFERFRESRLYVQTVCTAVLVGLAWLVHLLPYGPLARAGAAVEWAVTGDYDFRGQASRLQEWAGSQGGWQPALAGLWNEGVTRVRDWVGPVGPFAESRAVRSAPAEPVPGPAAGVAWEEESGSAASSSLEDAAGAGASTARESIQLPPLQPVEGSVLWEFGWLPQGVGEEFHEGMDYLAKAGTPVVAILDGTVTAVRHQTRMGTVVEIRHDDVVAVYAQVEAVEVRAGDEVRRGQMIAAVARSSGVEENNPPHLHFEIRPLATGEPVDPASYLGLGGKKL